VSHVCFMLFLNTWDESAVGNADVRSCWGELCGRDKGQVENASGNWASVVHMFIGVAPVTDFLKGSSLSMSDHGFVIVNKVSHRYVFHWILLLHTVLTADLVKSIIVTYLWVRSSASSFCLQLIFL